MKLQHTANLASTLSGNHLLLDTTTLINAAQSTEFINLLLEVVAAGCSLFTIPSVVYEFTRISRTLKEYRSQIDFLNRLEVTVYNRIEETINDEMRVFILAYNKACNTRNEKKAPSYTDSLLCATAYKFRNSNLKLISSNHKDIPESLFDRDELITIDVNGELRNEAIYSFSSTKFGKALSQLEQSQR